MADSGTVPTDRNMAAKMPTWMRPPARWVRVRYTTPRPHMPDEMATPTAATRSMATPSTPPSMTTPLSTTAGTTITTGTIDRMALYISAPSMSAMRRVGAINSRS